LISDAFDATRGEPLAENLYKDIPNARAAASSDSRFSTVIDVASVDNYVNRPVPLVFPCAALIRRPGVLDVLNAKFGGALDGRIPRTDCEATLPALPRLDRIIQAAERAQPPTNATIRFSTNRQYDMMIAAIRLHLPKYWKHCEQTSVATDVSDGEQDEHRYPDDSHFRMMNRAAIHGAVSELADYYVRAFHIAPGIAADQAAGAINAVIAGAYDACR
jgi:hypothetical protein